jgi:hypothetical protein
MDTETPAELTIDHLPNELLEQVLVRAASLSLSPPSLLRMVCRRWSWGAADLVSDSGDGAPEEEIARQVERGRLRVAEWMRSQGCP